MHLRHRLAAATLTITTVLVTAGPVTAAPGPTHIRDIQGTAHLSPLSGSTVTGVRGVVTGLKSTGFWMQDPEPDTDDATAEGIFVFTADAPEVNVGDEVTVDGKVTEYRSGGAKSANLTVTEISTPEVTTLGTRPLPAPVVIGSGGRVPPNAVIKRNAGDVETSGGFDPAVNGIDFWESLEGMLVTLPKPVAVGPYQATYGEIPVVNDDQNSVTRSARGGIVLQQHDGNPEIITLADKERTPSGVNVGDHFSGPATGIVDYIAGHFTLQLSSALSRVDSGLQRESTVDTPAGQLSVATFNVENLDPTDPQVKFDNLGATIVRNLKSPGIVTLEEIQDNNGATNDGTVDADRTFGALIDAITKAGGPTYAYTQINPVDGQDGGEPGGNIRVGFLYRTDLGISLAKGTAGGPTEAVTVTPGGGLSVNPGRIDPGNAAWAATRKPLVAEFLFQDKPVFVIANHWSSKGGDDPLMGRNQPARQPSSDKRTRQAGVVRDFVRQLLAADEHARIVVAGDLNDFEYSTAATTLAGAPLTDLPATLPDAERYTYVYQGNSQVLDHILLSKSLGADYGYDVVHVNSEFAVQDSDHDPQIVRLKF
ncbi:hypothetical protein D5S17_33020 [Pseudonocardiaceae bacterium YIM PH 21723]|nr:hypothetical protein D5S17_33020 [Pseudonocardiaceae bacterium YIM PH 21723]